MSMVWVYTLLIPMGCSGGAMSVGIMPKASLLWKSVVFPFAISTNKILNKQQKLNQGVNLNKIIVLLLFFRVGGVSLEIFTQKSTFLLSDEFQVCITPANSNM